MKELRKGLINLQNRVQKTAGKLNAIIGKKFQIFRSELGRHFWNFKIRLPNLALFAPLIGALVILIIVAFLFVAGFRLLHPGLPITIQTLLPDFYSNTITTLIDIVITVLIIDLFYRIRDDRLEKIRLLRDIGCGDQGIARRAILDITAKNLHHKGFLRYRIFEDAKLAGAMLASADLSHSSFYHSDFTGVTLWGAKLKMTSFSRCTLRGIDLRDADLDGAYFEYVDLTDALVTPTQLQSANRLHGSQLPNGKIYDGRFNLPVDIQDAQTLGVDIADPVAMAKWYAMPYDQFMHSMDLRKEKPEIDDWENW
jgi:hypothetical protein